MRWHSRVMIIERDNILDRVLSRPTKLDSQIVSWHDFTYIWTSR